MKLYLLIVSAILISSCESNSRYYKISGETHTPYHISFQSNSPNKVKKIVLEEIKAYYHALNPFDSLSIVSHINQNKEIEIDSIFIHAFRSARKISELTDGMVDITCAPLINLWGFGFSKMDTITPEIIDSLLTFVGYQKVQLENNKIIKEDSRTLLNFSTFGDGCICDLIADKFDKLGIKNYLIEFGGEMTIKGVNQNGEPWKVAIVKPIDDNSCTQNEMMKEILHIQEKIGLATSGDYRKFYIKDGKKFAHTLNPKTGYPAGQNILSATVLDEKCINADGISTAIMSMGLKGLDVLKQKVPDLKYYIIYTDSTGNYKTKYSSEMEKYLHKNH